MKKTQEEHRPSAGDIADLAALLRDSGDVKALNSKALRSTGSLRAANPDTLNSRSSFARLTKQMGPQQSVCRAVLPAPLAQMLDVSFELPYMGPLSDGEVPQQRGSVAQVTSDPPCNATELAVARGSQRTASRIFCEACCDGPARYASGPKCPWVLPARQCHDSQASSVSPYAWYCHGGHTWT